MEFNPHERRIMANHGTAFAGLCHYYGRVVSQEEFAERFLGCYATLLDWAKEKGDGTLEWAHVQVEDGAVHLHPSFEGLYIYFIL